MFDNDAVTLVWEQAGAGSHEFLPAGIRTIIGYSIQQSGQASDTLLKCGSDTIARNYARDAAFNQLSYHCSGSISVTKTGNDNIFISITYVPRDTRLIPQINPVYVASTSAVGQITSIDFSNPTLEAINGLTWIIYFGLGLMILLAAIRLGYELLRSKI